jgi:ribosomal protein S18 acetylase RimI-like enzyme
MTYRIIEKKDVDLEELTRLLKQTFWACNRSVEDVQTTIDNSICFCAYDENDRMVGFARVVTDRVSIWYLCDVIVDEAHRNQGIGRMLISAILSDGRFHDIYGLLRTSHANDLYRKFGFEDAEPDKIMFRDPNAKK